MNSRYLEGLETRLRSATSPEEVGLIQAEIASYYARQGASSRAQELLAKVRASAGALASGRVLAWVNLAEGLVEQFAGRPLVASTKWERARALAVAVEFGKVEALASAWLAFSAYLAEDLIRLDREFSSAIQATEADNASAIARLTLTLGLSFHYGGDVRRASENYRRSKHAANSVGDEVALSALIHDMASMRIAIRRNSELSIGHEYECRESLRTSVETAASFEELVGVSAAPSLGSLILAQDDILSLNWTSAIRRIDSSLESAEKDGFGRIQPGLLADRAYCLARLSELESARSDASDAICEAKKTTLHGDDRAVMLSRLSETYGILGQADEQAIYSALADEAWARVRSFRIQILEVARRLDEALGAKGFF